jgi:hypothetical protein
MSNTFIRAQDLEPAFGSVLKTEKGTFWIKEITSLFPWSISHRLYWATTRDRRHSVAVVSSNGTIQFLTSPDGWRILSGVLISEKGGLPANLSAVEIAEAVRKLTVGPPGLVATQELAQRNSPPLFAWMTGAPDGNEATFRSLCVTPLVQKISGNGDWAVVFNYFNDRGGVEHWTVRGKADGLVEVKMKLLFSDGTFNWPFE